jgi:peptide/nickel transport system substrate-binding protein
VPVAEMTQSQYNTRPVGTGPFELKEITATRAELIPNPRYPGPEPYLTGLTFRFYPDHQSLLPAYERGEIDGISWIWPADTDEVSAWDDLQLFSAPMSGYTLIYLNLQNPNLPFFKEQAVRQALLYGLDRQALIDGALHGQGLVADSPILPGSWAYDSETLKVPYDPEKAKALLDKAGWIDSDGDGVRDKDGVKLAFVLLGDDQAMVESIATQWAKIGVQAAPQAVTIAGLIGDFLVPRTYDAAIVHWEQTGDPDPYPLWHSTQIKAGQNYAGWDDRSADEAIELARSINDRAVRREYYKQFQRIFAEEVPALLIYHPVYSYGVRDKVHDVQMGPINSDGDRFRNVADWYIVTKRITVGGSPNATPTKP